MAPNKANGGHRASRSKSLKQAASHEPTTKSTGKTRSSSAAAPVTENTENVATTSNRQRID